MGAEREPPHPIEPLIPPGELGVRGLPQNGDCFGAGVGHRCRAAGL